MNNKINEQILNVIEKHQKTPPVDILAIADDLQINVYKAVGEELSGMIVKSAQGGASGYAIYVNRSHSFSRQRFTIAHEIAHFILHRDAIGDGIVDDALYRSGLSNKQEAEANKLAAEILMPWHLLNRVMSENIKTISDLASRFQVSESAMSIRLGIPS